MRTILLRGKDIYNNKVKVASANENSREDAFACEGDLFMIR